MTPEHASAELVRLERRLEEARMRLRNDPATRYRSPMLTAPPGLFRVSLLGVVVVAAAAVAVVGVIEEQLAVTFTAAAVAALALAATVYVYRRIVLPAERAKKAKTRAPRDLQRALLLEVDAVYAALDGRPPAASDLPLALPRPRQPSLWAQTMHGRYYVGDAPEVVLRRLPHDAPEHTVWFHRCVGPSGLRAIVIATSLTVFATVALALGILAET